MKSVRSSSLPQLSTCPGAFAACKGLTSPDNPASLEGTQNHLAMEAYYRGIEFDESRLTDSGSMLTRWFSKEMDGLIESHGGATQVMTELELSAEVPGTNGVVLTGHVDLVVICDDSTVIVTDWKFGRLEVTPAPRNVQLMAYIWLLAVTAKESGEFKTDSIDGYIFSAGSEKAFTGARCDAGVIANVGTHLATIINAAVAEDAKHVPSENACRYCEAAGTDRCPESKELVQQNAVGLELMTIEAAGLPADPLEVVKIFDAVKQVESIGRKFMARLKEAIEADPEAWAEYFELKDGNNVRTITDVQAVYDKIVTGADLVSAEAFLNAVDLKIGALEGLCKEALKDAGVKVKDQKGYIAELLGDLIEQSQNKPSIKRVA